MVAVLIPSYRHAAFLATALGSALRCPEVSEILISDDGSDDGSALLIERWAAAGRVRRVGSEGAAHIGAARRLDTLVAAAQEDWVAVLNSDDAFAAGRFAAVAVARRDPRVELVTGAIGIVDAGGRPAGYKRGALDPEYPFPPDFEIAERLANGELLDLLASQNVVATTSNLVFTRALHARTGGFRDFRYVHDWDFALRACLCGRAAYVPQVLSIYRAHASNTIRAPRAEVAAEVTALFRDLLADFPALADRSGFRLSLRANPYLAPGVADALLRRAA